MGDVSAIPIPHLTTALDGPLQELEQHLLDHQIAIETWLRKQWQATPAPIHSSVDLRNAGFKLSPVDTNLFPAGFNNLNQDFMPLCIQAAQAIICNDHPGCERILLIPENHTRNLGYLESIATLQDILQKAGFEVRIGSMLETLTNPLVVTLPSEREITLEPLQRSDDKVHVDNFIPCLIFLNNDLSEGVPPQLQDITQYIRPPLALGWASRTKTQHFEHYNHVANEFAELIEIDPWLINPKFRYCEGLDFIRREGEECVIHHVDALLQDIQKKYDEYNIQEKPYVIIKADSGTYGMGVMAVYNAEDIRNLNRKQRSKMAAAKGKQEVNRVLIQEGVYSFESIGKEKSAAEPVVYMLGHFVVGGFYRVHRDRSMNDVLNAPGMHFEPLAFVDSCTNPDMNKAPNEVPNRFYAYGVVARLALLAAARELREVKHGH